MATMTGRAGKRRRSKSSPPSSETLDEAITASTARAEELFEELVDTLMKEDDPLGVACSLVIQLTHFLAEAKMTAERQAQGAAMAAD